MTLPHGDRRHTAFTWTVMALAAMLAALPLLTHGYSCGHDFDFHLRSWMEAAAAWHGGIVKPVWSFHAAWNAGEPRLLFYPPLSWIMGALLSLVVPWSGIAFTFTWLVFLLTGMAMHRLLRRWVAPGAAIFGGCLYLANPYMLFCAYERTAYAELMAAVWMPLLLASLLRERVTAWRVAAALALLWITNAPAGVMGCYTVLLVGGMRLLWMLYRRDVEACPFAARVTSGVALAFLLDSFYLLPFAVERKYIQLTTALTPAASPDANFLYQFTKDAFHNGVLLHSSNIAVVLVAVAVLCGAGVLLLHRHRIRSVSGMAERQRSQCYEAAEALPVPLLMVFTIAVLLLQLPLSIFLWHHAPELNFLQFPWRLLAMQGAVTAALVALLVDRLRSRDRVYAVAAAGLLLAAACSYGLGNTAFRQGCDDEEGLQPQWTSFRTGAGFEDTDEYTPIDDDNDVLKIRLPEAWSADDPNSVPASGNGSLPAGTPLPTVTHQKLDDIVITATGRFLIVRLRPFHGWHVLRDGVELSEWPQRADGLLAVPLAPAGEHRVEVRYRKTWDQWAGGALSLLSLLGLFAVARAERPRTPLR